MHFITESSAETSVCDEGVIQQRMLALVNAVAMHDEEALTEIYGLCSGLLFALSKAILQSAEDAREIVIDVFSWLWQNADRYEPLRGGVMAWLSVITRRRSIDRLRRRRKNVSTDALYIDMLIESGLEERHSPDHLLSLLQESSSVYHALSLLTPLRRQLVHLAFFQGLTHEEIAAYTSLPLGSVKSHVRRALLTMRESLMPTRAVTPAIAFESA